MNNSQTKINTMKLVLVISFVLMGLKFLAYYLTNSNAILTDAIESIVNILAGSFALYSLYYAAKPKDEDHPYGHGKIEFLSTGVEGGMVTLAGAAMLIKGIASIFSPHDLENVDIGLAISVFSGGVNFLLARVLIKKGTVLHSTTMVVECKTVPFFIKTLANKKFTPPEKTEMAKPISTFSKSCGLKIEAIPFINIAAPAKVTIPPSTPVDKNSIFP